MQIYAFHGHIPEENQTGAWYTVNLELDVAFDSACISDDLNDTYDYSQAYRIVRDEMECPSKLLEHVAYRILKQLLASSDMVEQAAIHLAKINPPFGGHVASVSVELKMDRGI